MDPSVPYDQRQTNNEETCPPKDKSQIEETLAAFNPVDNALVVELYATLREQLGFEKVCMVEVNHCLQAYCAVVVSSTYGNILYSGDTLPCVNLQNYAQTARVLIHEATLQDGMEEDAQKKMHTTTGQALNIGIKCGVYRTILTHFSPRYQKVAEITPLMEQARAIVAFDHTRVSWSQLEWAYRITPIFGKLLSNEEEKKPIEESKSKKGGK